MQSDPDVTISADLLNISVGRFGSPVLGSGVFVSGAGDEGGRLKVQHLQTDGVYSAGRISAGTADQITGGVFTAYGANVDVVANDLRPGRTWFQRLQRYGGTIPRFCA